MLIETLGRRTVALVEYVLNLLLMAYLAARAAMFEDSQGFREILRVISAQVYFTGWQAVPIISTLALATGSIIILNSSAQMSLIGDVDMIGNIVVVVAVRELCPLITALIVIARSGTAVASELGNMKVNREIDALRSMGINPLSYIVFPRLLGGIISVLCLAFYFNLMAVMGGYLVTSFISHLPFGFYMTSVAQAITGEDIALFFIKNLVSGTLIFTVACYQGLQVKQSPHEVPQTTTKAVMISVLGVTIFNLTTTAIVSLSQLGLLGAA